MQFDEDHLYYDNYNARFYKYGNELLKIFRNYVPEFLESQLMYNDRIHKKVDNHIILPNKLLYNNDGSLQGYKMKFVKGQSLDNEIKKNKLNYEETIFLINELFRLLKEIHEYLIVGDIRNANLLIGKNGAYMIDLDYAVKKDSSDLPLCSYRIQFNDEYLYDQNSDMVKMYISTLSLLYNYNLEEEFSRFEYLDYLDDFIPLSGYLKEYFYYLKNCIAKNQNASYYLKIPFSSNIEKEISTASARILRK